MAGEIRIDRDRCMGSSHCAYYAPNTFAQDELTIAVVVDPEGDDDAAVRQAVEFCPTGAISTIEITKGS